MKPFEQGWQAFKKGNLGNPYETNTQQHRDWEFGFNKAYFSNLERLNAKDKEAGTRPNSQAS